jgi:HEAT repeat protein
MSADPEFQNLIDTLQNSPNASARKKAALALGDYVDNLSDDEYERARTALDRALSDPDPIVITTAMGALTKFNRQSGGDDFMVQGDSEEDMLHPPEQAVCSVCGRPEALIPDGGCERDDCPYK